jgi:divalent metal cation (Fe/Co/Zn/Cd) transporter
LHIQVPPHLTTEVSHKVAHDVEEALRRQWPDIDEVLIHTEPSYITRADFQAHEAKQ